MTILITGCSGLIGTALKNLFISQGHTVHSLSHSNTEGSFFWDPINNEIDPAAFKQVDAVIHLAGTPIFARWTKQKMQEIRDSRVKGAQLLVEQIAQLPHPPKTIITASGINFYGTKRAERLHEESQSGTGFLSEVSKSWESAFDPLKEKGIRIVYMRTPMVLSAKGGALARMLPIFKLGLGGRLGRGTQWMSWITLEDLVCAYDFCLNNNNIHGAINAVSPKPISNFNFKETLAQVLQKPTLLPIPAWTLKLIFGQMAQETMLASLMVTPQKLLSNGFKFKYPELKSALTAILKSDSE